MFVDGQKHAFQRFDCHQQVIDNKFHSGAIDARHIVNEHHAVEAAERMVARENHTSVCRVEVFSALNAVGDIEMIEHTATEFGVAHAGGHPQHFVHLILADNLLQTSDHPSRNVATLSWQTAVYHFLQVDSDWLSGLSRVGHLVLGKFLCKIKRIGGYLQINGTQNCRNVHNAGLLPAKRFGRVEVFY